MNQRERHAWHGFREVMARRQMEFDGQVPIALLIATVCHGGDGCHGPEHDDEVNVHLDGALAILRPPGMPPAMVAGLLERAAEELRTGSMR